MPENTESNIDQDKIYEMNEEQASVDADKLDNDEAIGTNTVPLDNAGQEIKNDAPSGESSVEKDPIEEARIELAELKDKYIRLYADFENFRRRTAKEKLEMISGASADMVKAILPIVDDFERAKVSFESSTEIDALKEGVDLIYTKLSKTLEAKGLKPMESKGETFDAELHESIAQFPAPSEDLKGKVIDEIEKGYFLNDKVIRYAKVIVGA
ncbi:nucleotide exchange factor GrpE [Dyadobacter fanqingshengii]|uniref:Protein GrpE n=1 Tax=Dyadobacter fanqingshengii TaxID=2906443 RepID=A0A9X1T895_9BACT|nr:nucleotide exchange factor GrpE [Dyadobacter fanqingshengii]MCF0039456.1 nucleotide exchange factor GrpE [Dyadobacter fanqingshengii]USJ33734.1 nucleotide exchange factor GrpE [Dyadobacter fanqingshengii]